MRPALTWLVLAIAGPAPASADDPRPVPPATVPTISAEAALIQDLAADPITAPYRFVATRRADGKILLRGRVGSRAVYDEAVRVAIGGGYPIVEALTIDTGVAVTVLPPPPLLPPPAYVYPPPLFGAIDDPFFGLEPPPISYPPYWPWLSARRLADFDAATMPAAAPAMAPVPRGTVPLSESVELTIDPTGVGTLRGRVPTLADKLALGRQLAGVSGVNEVINLLDVAEDDPGPADPPTAVEPVAPAPEPDPSFVPPPPPPPAPEPDPTLVAPAPPGRLDPAAEALAGVPELAALPIRTSVRDGVATIAGKVPGAAEAFRAWDAVRKAPGVLEVVDRLEFPPPAGDPPRNPLVDQADREGVAAYLEAQVRKQVGDQARIDGVRLLGRTLEVRAATRRPEDRARIEAILRSTPVLRGLTVELVDAGG